MEKKLTKCRKSLENPEKHFGRGLEWEKVFWEVKRQRNQEKDRQKRRTNRTEPIYRGSVKLDRRRCREVLIKVSSPVSRIWPSTNIGVEEMSRYKTSNTKVEARSIHQVLRSYRGDMNFLDRPTKCLGGNEITIRKSLEARQIAKCREGVEEVSS